MGGVGEGYMVNFRNVYLPKFQQYFSLYAQLQLSTLV